MYQHAAVKPFAHLDRLQAWKRGETPAPVTVEWTLSNACNLQCEACHFSHLHTAGPWSRHLRPEGYLQTGVFADTPLVFRALGEMAAAGVQGVVWSGGGEPTLHPDVLAIWSHAHTLGLQQGLYTHGGLLDTLGPAGGPLLTWAVVSLDACDRATYREEKRADRFVEACQGVRTLVAAGTVVGVSFLLHAGNWHQIVDMLRVSRSLGSTYTSFRPRIDTDPTDPGRVRGSRAWIDDALLSSLDSLAREPDVELDVQRFRAYRHWTDHGYPACFGIRLSTAITPDGQVWICSNRMAQAGAAIGSLREQSFADLWASHPRQVTDFLGCRAMCRLHTVNQTLDAVFTPVAHEVFV